VGTNIVGIIHAETKQKISESLKKRYNSGNSQEEKIK